MYIIHDKFTMTYNICIGTEHIKFRSIKVENILKFSGAERNTDTFVISCPSRVPTLPGKPGILHFTLPCLEKGWSFSKALKSWNFYGKPGIFKI